MLNASGFDASITAGSGGQFDVLADGSLVFSKELTGRFPEDGEVLELLGSGSP